MKNLKQIDDSFNELNKLLKLDINYSKLGNDDMVKVKHILADLHSEFYKQNNIIENLKLRRLI